MAFPDPVPGLVIRDSYLWYSEARRGREEGRKDRPCAIVLASKLQPNGRLRVVVAPITHAPPAQSSTAIELPPKVGDHLGLDTGKSWIVTDEVNVFTWPGPDLRIAKGREFSFGHLPRKLALHVRESVLENSRKHRKTVKRD